jgi:DNA-binding response OmpR family regulator
MTGEPRVTFLLAEDDDGHARLMQKNLARAGFTEPLLRFANGEAAVGFLQRDESSPDQTYILLLDFRLPRLSGVEVLRWLRAGTNFQTIPVLMLSTTDDPRDLAACQALGCDGFLVKPVDEHKLKAALVPLVRRVTQGRGGGA